MDDRDRPRPARDDDFERLLEGFRLPPGSSVLDENDVPARELEAEVDELISAMSEGSERSRAERVRQVKVEIEAEAQYLESQGVELRRRDGLGVLIGRIKLARRGGKKGYLAKHAKIADEIGLTGKGGRPTDPPRTPSASFMSDLEVVLKALGAGASKAAVRARMTRGAYVFDEDLHAIPESEWTRIRTAYSLDWARPSPKQRRAANKHANGAKATRTTRR